MNIHIWNLKVDLHDRLLHVTCSVLVIPCSNILSRSLKSYYKVYVAHNCCRQVIFWWGIYTAWFGTHLTICPKALLSKRIKIYHDAHLWNAVHEKCENVSLGFDTLMMSDRRSDLALMYQLFSRVRTGTEELCKAFSLFVKVSYTIVNCTCTWLSMTCPIQPSIPK